MTAVHENSPIEENAKVLVVDDEPFNLEIMQEILSGAYQVSCASSGPECLASLRQMLPDVILLDINMPGMSGYEVCQQIKQNAATRDIPVAFVSALDTLAERLAGYDVGGDDYITKPFAAKELLKRIDLAIQYRKEKETLKRDADWALHEAQKAQTANNEMGIVFQFLQHSFSCNEVESLAAAVGDALKSLGVNGSVQIRADEKIIHKSSTGVVVPLEQTLVKKIHSEDGFIDLGGQVIINFQHVSILVKDLSHENLDLFKRLRASIMFLAEYVNSRVVTLVATSAFSTQKKMLNNMTNKVHSSLDEIIDIQRDHHSKNKQLMTDFMADLNACFDSLSLDQDQQSQLQLLLNKSADVITHINNANSQADANQTACIENIKQSLSLPK